MKDQKSTDRKTPQTLSTSLKSEKKKWKKPQLTRLNVQDTKGGEWDSPNEGSWWIFNWGPHS